MRKVDVLAYFARRPPGNRGAVRKIARALDMSEAAVYRWGELVPELAARRLHDMTEGDLEFEARHYRQPESEGAA